MTNCPYCHRPILNYDTWVKAENGKIYHSMPCYEQHCAEQKILKIRKDS